MKVRERERPIVSNCVVRKKNYTVVKNNIKLDYIIIITISII
jgi:hypothetical protein